MSKNKKSRKQQTSVVANSVKKNVEDNFAFSASCLLIVGIFVGGITNLNALHSTASGILAEKFNPVLTVGGLLIHPTFNGLSQVLASILFLYLLFFRRAKKNFIDYLIIGCVFLVIVVGSNGVATQSHWSASIFLWIVLQAFQFFGIFSPNPFFRTLAFSTYILEFAFQCHATPITDLGLWDTVGAIALHDLHVSDFKIGMILLNVACMMSVEWLTKILFEINESNSRRVQNEPA